MSRILEFEGARGLLALWVVVYHVFAITGAPVPAALEGGHAVAVFFALSGFVIALLLSRRRETYGPFITRRFFRLFPAFAVCVVAGVALTFSGIMPLRPEAGTVTAHLLLKATMLHGALPVHWLPESSSSFLNPAWSISTEWQFYLVIPLFFWLVRRSPVAGWGALMLAAAFSKRIMAPLGFGGASLFMNAFLFALGIVCYFVYAWVRDHRESVRAAGPLLPFVLPALPLALIPIVPNVGSLVWLFLFGLVLSGTIGGSFPPIRWTADLLSSGPAVWLGSVSYSLYLGHEPLIWLARYGAESLGLEGAAMTLVVGVLSIPMSLIVAYLLYRFVEVPSIKAGKRLTQAKQVLTPELEVARQASP